MFTDTHAHLNFDPFFHNPEPYITRAREAGVTQLIIPSIDLESADRAISLTDRFDGIYAAVGIHPQDSIKVGHYYLSELEQRLKHPKVVAVGEIGMDFYRDYAPAGVQERVFREQVQLAKQMDYPVIIHNREADTPVLKVLNEVDYFYAQFHCFGSDADFARKIISKGALVSFTGVLTFSKKTKKVAKELPLEKLMIETDCPWMAPIPYRGKTNEPAYVTEIARGLGEIFKKDPTEIGKMTSETAESFFRLQKK